MLSLALVFVSVLEGVYCVSGGNFHPRNGSVVTHRVGEANVTFECDIYDDNGNRTFTQWNIENFRGEPGLKSVPLTFNDTLLEGDVGICPVLTTCRDRLIFPEFLADFDGATLVCGTAINDMFTVGQFFLRVYREPSLQNLTNPLRYVQGSNLVVNLEQAPPAHPFPTSFQWFKEGVAIMNDSIRVLGYPTLNITTVRTSDSGEYSLLATNYLLDDPERELGSGRGGFTLNVVFGPDLDFGPEERAVLLGDSLSLLCGTNLMSNPPSANITWLDPLGNKVVDDDRYNLINDDTGVRLELNGSRANDVGVWMCIVSVEGSDVTLPSGETRSSFVVGMKMLNISLQVVDAPGSPRNFSVDETGGTWANVCWQKPSSEGMPGIARYIVIATDTADGTTVNASTEDSATRLNVTNLLPNTQYQFVVRAVAEVLNVTDIGPVSNSASGTTTFTVPSLVCNKPKSINGSIFVSWTFVHTGGQSLNEINITYQFEQNNVNQRRMGPSVTINDTMAVIPELVAGYTYVPIVTASNNIGATTVECPAIEHKIGIPQPPQILPVKELEGLKVRLSVRTLFSGVERGDTVFFFFTQTNINSRENITFRKEDIDYTDGKIITIDREGFMVGENYSFTAQAGNRFGNSTPVPSNSIITIIGIFPSTTSPTPAETSGENIGTIIGIIVGVLMVILLGISILLVILFLFFKYKRSGQSYKPANKEKNGSPPGVKVEEIAESEPTIDIGQDLSSIATTQNTATQDTATTQNTATTTELHYAELDTFSSPNSIILKKPPTQPVEYATIDSFKKAPEATSQSKTADGDDKVGTSTTVV